MKKEIVKKKKKEINKKQKEEIIIKKLFKKIRNNCLIINY
jgi:hypothetical protein